MYISPNGWLAAYLRTPFSISLPKSVCTMFWHFVLATVIYAVGLLIAFTILNGFWQAAFSDPSVKEGFYSTFSQVFAGFTTGVTAILGLVWGLARFKVKAKKERQAQFFAANPDHTSWDWNAWGEDKWYPRKIEAAKRAEANRIKKGWAAKDAVRKTPLSYRIKLKLEPFFIRVGRNIANAWSTFIAIIVALYERFHEKTCARIQWEDKA